VHARTVTGADHAVAQNSQRLVLRCCLRRRERWPVGRRDESDDHQYDREGGQLTGPAGDERRIYARYTNTASLLVGLLLFLGAYIQANEDVGSSWSHTTDSLVAAILCGLAGVACIIGSVFTRS
jgi:hypothetical protein